MGLFDDIGDAVGDAADSVSDSVSDAVDSITGGGGSSSSGGSTQDRASKVSRQPSSSPSRDTSGSLADSGPVDLGGGGSSSSSSSSSSGGGSSSSSSSRSSRRRRRDRSPTRTVTETVTSIGGGLADRVDSIYDDASQTVSSTVDEATDTARDITTGGIESGIDAISNVGGPSDSSGGGGGSPTAPTPPSTNDFTGQSTREGIGTETPFDDPPPDDPVERVEAGLNDVSKTIRPTLRGTGNIAGRAVATASLAPAVEEAAFGTRQTEDAIVGAGEEAALALDLPGAASAGVSGADFVVRGPDNTDLTRREAAERTVSQGVDQFTTAAQESPVETTGRAVGALAGGFGVGTAAARGGRRLAGGLGSADDVGGATRTGSQIDTGGLGSRGSGSLFDSDAVTQANRQSRGGSTTTTSAESGTQPLGGSGGSTGPTASLDRIAEGVESGRIGQSRAAVRDLNDRVEDMDFFGDNRASAQLGRQRSREPRQSQTPDLAEDRVTPNLYQQSIDNQLRRQRRATDDSTFDGGGNPFNSDDLRARREADAEAIARRERENPGALFDEATDVTGFGSVEGFGGGVGGLGGFLGSTTLSGQETPASGQTLFEQTEEDIFGDDDTGLDSGLGGDTATDTGLDTGGDTDTGLDSGLGGDTATDTDTAVGQTFTLRETARTGSQPGQRPANTPTTPTTETFGETTLGRPTTGGGGRGPTTRTGRTPTPDFGLGEESDEEEIAFGLESDGEVFSSGILSGEEALTNVGGRDLGDANTPAQVDLGLDDVFPGAPNHASRNDGFSL